MLDHYVPVQRTLEDLRDGFCVVVVVHKLVDRKHGPCIHVYPIDWLI